MDRERIAVSTPAEWAETCSDSFVPLRVRSVDRDFRASLSRVELTSRVGVTRVASSSSEVYRSARVIAQEPRDDLLLSVHRNGVGTVIQDDRVATLRPGTAALYDAAHPYVLSFPGVMSEIVLQIPRGALGLSETRIRDATARTLLPSVPLKALSTLMSVAAGCNEPGMEPTDGMAMADAAVSLLRAAIDPASAGTPVSNDHLALRVAMMDFIEEKLGDPGLCATAVAHQHHVSLRFAQQVFAQSGDGIARHIRTRRLERARSLIDSGMGVTSAAVRAGFFDPGTFTRAFKRAYSMTPRDYSVARRGGPPHARTA